VLVVSFESRRSREIAELIRRHGGEPVSAPSMREVPLDQSGAAVEFARRLREGRIDVVIFLTGVGTRLVAQAVASEMPPVELGRCLTRVTTVARGPKPVAALRELGVAPTISVPEPNTWREVLAAIDERVELAGRTVAVQEYGEENPELLDGLRERGATVVRVPVYRWALPEDLGPLRDGIRRILAGEIDVALFTSATQVEHLFQIAGEESTRLAEMLSRNVVVGSIGPICSRALERHALRADLEPEHPKMGPLVRETLQRAPAILDRKRRLRPNR
jgi:uroporphyrinogen-III synthase